MCWILWFRDGTKSHHCNMEQKVYHNACVHMWDGARGNKIQLLVYRIFKSESPVMLIAMIKTAVCLWQKNWILLQKPILFPQFSFLDPDELHSLVSKCINRWTKECWLYSRNIFLSIYYLLSSGLGNTHSTEEMKSRLLKLTFQWSWYNLCEPLCCLCS